MTRKSFGLFLYYASHLCYDTLQTQKGDNLESDTDTTTTRKRSFSDTCYNDTCNKCEQKSTYPYTFKESVSIVLILLTQFKKCKQKCKFSLHIIKSVRRYEVLPTLFVKCE